MNTAEKILVALVFGGAILNLWFARAIHIVATDLQRLTKKLQKQAEELQREIEPKR